MGTCFIGVNPWVLIVVTTVLTIFAVYLVLISHLGEKRGTYLVLGFVVITVLGLLLFTCWAFVVGLLELIVGFLMNRDKLRILRIS